jgi:hypothetical protein
MRRIKKIKEKKNKWIYPAVFVLVILLAVYQVLAGYAIALLFAALSFAYGMIKYANQNIRRVALVILPFLIIFSASLNDSIGNAFIYASDIVVSPPLKVRLEAIGNGILDRDLTTADYSKRISLYSDSMEKFLRYPVFGTYFSKEYDEENIRVGTHSGILGALSGWGLLGGGCLIGLFLSVGIKRLNYWRKTNYQYVYSFVLVIYFMMGFVKSTFGLYVITMIVFNIIPSIPFALLLIKKPDRESNLMIGRLGHMATIKTVKRL